MANNKTVFQELYALYSLQTIIPERYRELSHVGGNESPDLQDIYNSIGVEVTSSSRDQEIHFYYNAYYGKPIDSVPKHVIEKIRNAGYWLMSSNGVVQLLYGPHAYEMASTEQLSAEALARVKCAVKAKQAKLNSNHFRRFTSNELFIFADSILMDRDIAEYGKTINNLFAEYKEAFSTIFICKSWEIFCVRTKTGQIEHYDLSHCDNDIFLRAFNEAGLVFQEE